MAGGQKNQKFLKSQLLGINVLSFKNLWPLKNKEDAELGKDYSSEKIRPKIENKNNLEKQTSILKNNSPIALLLIATGIGLYFNLPGEGNAKVCSLLLIGLLILVGLSQKYRYINNFIISTLIILIGYSLALYRTHTSATPLLSQTLKSYDVVMMVEDNEPLQKNRIRYTGKLLSLSKRSEYKIPKRIRIRTSDQGPRFKYGDLLCMRAMLARPKGLSELAGMILVLRSGLNKSEQLGLTYPPSDYALTIKDE